VVELTGARLLRPADLRDVLALAPGACLTKSAKSRYGTILAPEGRLGSPARQKSRP
jgi:hypothetical protein